MHSHEGGIFTPADQAITATAVVLLESLASQCPLEVPLPLLSPAEVARIRKERGWSQQHLASLSKVNKAYISEYESGIRPNLPEEMLQRISDALLAEPEGRIIVGIKRQKGRPRLILRDPHGKEYTPPSASVQWTETDGTTHSVYLGEV